MAPSATYQLASQDYTEFAPMFTAEEAQLVAQTIWGEARGQSKDEWRMVAWCICNRVSSTDPDFVQCTSIKDAVTLPGQFSGYSPNNPVDPECLEVATEVLTEWSKGGTAIVVPPYSSTSGYLFFTGDGVHNYFREEWR